MTELSESSRSESVQESDSRFVDPCIDCVLGALFQVGTDYVCIKYQLFSLQLLLLNKAGKCLPMLQVHCLDPRAEAQAAAVVFETQRLWAWMFL